MSDPETRWVARLTPLAGKDVADLLNMPLGLDVWERQADALVVAAGESHLAEIERRRLASVERLATVAQYLARAQKPPSP